MSARALDPDITIEQEVYAHILALLDRKVLRAERAMHDAKDVRTAFRCVARGERPYRHVFESETAHGHEHLSVCTAWLCPADLPAQLKPNESYTPLEVPEYTEALALLEALTT